MHTQQSLLFTGVLASRKIATKKNTPCRAAASTRFLCKRHAITLGKTPYVNYVSDYEPDKVDRCNDSACNIAKNTVIKISLPFYHAVFLVHERYIRIHRLASIPFLPESNAHTY